MGFSCNNKKSKINVSTQLINDTEFLRDIGLSNINNIKTEVDFCSEIFRNPEYYVTGARTLVTGMTTTLTGCTTGDTAVYNLTYTPTFNINFNLTGDTTYTGYTGGFCYRVYSDENFTVDGPFRGLLPGSEFINRCFAFSAITSTTLTQTFDNTNLVPSWKQYMIRPYYIFFSNICSPGLEFDSSKSTPQLNIISEGDYYFMTVVNPPVPILAGPIDYNSTIAPGFVSDLILSNGVTSNPTGPQALGELNYFNLSLIPTSPNSVIVFLNGVALAQNMDYQIVNYGGYGTPPTLIFTETIKETDWIIAYYPVGSQPANFNNPGWSVENFKVDSANFVVNIGDPGLGVNYVNYNTVTNKQEIFLRANITDNDIPILFINGVQIAYGDQFNKSNTVANMLILNEELIHVGDIVSIFYNAYILVGTDYGSLTSPEFTVIWTSPGELPKNVGGEFIISMYNNDDPSNTVLYQKTVDFVENQSNYIETMSNLALNISYRFEVVFKTVYTAYMDNKVTTCSIATGYVNTKGPIINNTY